MCAALYWRGQFPIRPSQGYVRHIIFQNPRKGDRVKALLHRALNGNWEWIDKDLTLVTIPGVGHFVQQDAADLVTRTMKMWLAR